MTYDEALTFIHSVAWKGSRPGLERITTLLSMLGDPQEKLKFIHIAGTNGKGSVSAMTESVLRRAGYRTGLFISPYIKQFNERICFMGCPISNEALAEATAQVKPFAEKMEDAPTEFELITAIGLVYFLSVGCDVVVLETGMGGRLDSTNVIRAPLATAITGIALDHTEFLGDTIEKIAAEKAGITKAGRPMIYGGHDQSARRVIEEKAASMNAPFYAAEDTKLTVLSSSLNGTYVNYGFHNNIFLPLLGTYQPQNLATALTLIQALKDQGMPIADEAIREGIAAVRWRGRFERLCDAPLIISDGAHNPEGVAAAAECIRSYFPGVPVLLLCGVMADKDYPGMIKTLSPLALGVHTLTPSNPRALGAGAFAEAWQEQGVPAVAHDTVREAVLCAVFEAKERQAPLICLGSLYMYAEVTEVLASMGLYPSMQ